MFKEVGILNINIVFPWFLWCNLFLDNFFHISSKKRGLQSVDRNIGRFAVLEDREKLVRLLQNLVRTVIRFLKGRSSGVNPHIDMGSLGDGSGYEGSNRAVMILRHRSKVGH